jgi:uncharacterized protein (DUF4415 family)
LIDDDSNPERTAAEFEAAKGPGALPPGPAAGFPRTKSRGGRPAGSDKQMVSIRLDKDAVEKFRAAGPGRQARINAVLKRARVWRRRTWSPACVGRPASCLPRLRCAAPPLP